MKKKSYLLCCTALLAVGFVVEGHAQQATQPGALSSQERQELSDLLRQFDPDRPAPETLFEQRWLLKQLRDLTVLAVPSFETETLTVCDTIGDPHLLKDDVVILTRLGSSGAVRMEVVRNPGPSQTHPWTNPNGGDTFFVTPSITGKAHMNPSFKKFTPEGIGRARVSPHTGGTPPTDHDFFLRRDTRTPDAKCSNPDPLLIQVPEQHTSGARHGGTAVLD